MDINSALWWLLLNAVTIVILAFFSMQEMACVSFNRIRLHYYVNKGIRKAIWLNELLQNPARLFGTTLLSVNIAMFFGSECARQFYLSLGLSPDIAPLTQVALVIIFAELAPMFAARRYAEYVAMSGIGILYVTSKIMAPLLWSLNFVSKIADFFTSGRAQGHPLTVLSQEDLQTLLSEDEDRQSDIEGEEINTVASNIFSMRSKKAINVMTPIQNVLVLPSNATVGQFRQQLAQSRAEFIPIYQSVVTHIVGIAKPRDLIRIPDNRKLRDYATSAWFISENAPAINILKDFRRNQRNVAIVLDNQGLSVGMITLDDLTEEIFIKIEQPKESPPLIIDRTFPADMSVREFNEEFDVELKADPDITLEALMIQEIGHHPEVGESVYIPPFELTVKETSLTEIKRISIKTHL